jgi:hypothetical protein
MIALLLLVGSGTICAQNLTITGTVTSASDNEPLIGASVHVKGSSSGAVTDIDGAYSIKAAKGQTLVFSYIGYTSKEVTVSGNSLNVALTETTGSLEELVMAFKRRNSSPVLPHKLKVMSSPNSTLPAPSKLCKVKWPV